MNTCILGVCIVAAQLTHGEITNNKRPLMNTAYSYDGVARDISRFYKPKGPKANIGGYIVTRDKLKFSLSYDNGVSTEKYKRDETVKLGITKYFVNEDNTQVFSIGMSQTFGGKTSHTPCTDDYERQYYCGTLTDWKDFNQSDHENEQTFKLTYKYRF